MKNKKILIAAAFVLVLQCFAAQVKLQVIPRTVIAGEPAELLLTVESSHAPSFTTVPKIKGLEWLGSASSIQSRIINGKYSGYGERRYSFIIEKPGTYTIPAGEVRAGKDKMMTEAFTFTVEKASLRTNSSNTANANHSGEIEIDQAVFSELSIPGEKKTYYTGEYIPVEIKVFCLSGVKLQLAYPAISANNDNIIFRNYKDVNPQNPDFDRPSSFVEMRDGKEYICYRFRTEVKAIAVGELQLSARTLTEVQVPGRPSSRSSRDPFFDDFFNSGFFARTVRHTATAESGKLSIVPLPPAPKDVVLLGLTGNWNLNISLSSKKTEVGKAVTLLIRASGIGSLETLHAPELEFPGFRVYSPEISRSADGRSAEIRYILIPAKAGNLELEKTFATFHPQSGKYAETKFRAEVSVDNASAIIPSVQGANVVDTARPEPEMKEDPVHALAGIMYLKKVPERMENGAVSGKVLTFLFLIAGVLFLAVCEIAAAAARGNSSKSRRRAAARKQKKSLLHNLKQADSNGIYQMAPEISDYMNNVMDFPPGTSLDEISAKIETSSPDLAAELKGISAGAWVPGAAEFSGERKEKLIRLLGKVICISAMFCAFSAFADQAQTIKDYDSGKFKEALVQYETALEKSPESPALLYNAGNCFFQLKEFPKALLCYERAHLLSPRDEEIKRNLALTRRALDLPDKYSADTPSDLPGLLRDQLTPEEWMAVAAFGLLLLFIAVGLRHFAVRKYVSGPSALIGGILLILGVAMMVSQYQTSYAPDRAMILKDRIRLRNLPSESSDFINEDLLFAGEEVEIREKRRGNWIRIKAGNAVGWIPANAAGFLNGKDLTYF